MPWPIATAMIPRRNCCSRDLRDGNTHCDWFRLNQSSWHIERLERLFAGGSDGGGRELALGRGGKLTTSSTSKSNSILLSSGKVPWQHIFANDVAASVRSSSIVRMVIARSSFSCEQSVDIPGFTHTIGKKRFSSNCGRWFDSWCRSYIALLCSCFRCKWAFSPRRYWQLSHHSVIFGFFHKKTIA